MLGSWCGENGDDSMAIGSIEGMVCVWLLVCMMYGCTGGKYKSMDVYKMAGHTS